MSILITLFRLRSFGCVGVFQVVATDAREPSFVSTATVTIQVIDVNDNFPIFEKNAYNLFVPEHSENGIHIETITVGVWCSPRLGLVPVLA